MKTQTVSANAPAPNLDFTSVKPGRCTAYGVVCDDKGNTFDIEIKGTDEKEVRKFIRYELKQAKQGKGIKVRIEPTDAVLPAKPEKAPKRVHGQAKWNGISLKIREKRVDAPKPYKLHVEIDPVLSPWQSQDFTFDDQTTANVNIDVTFGKATVRLYEFIDPLRTISAPALIGANNASSCSIWAGTQETFNCSSSYSQDWNFRVTAGPSGAIFTLSLDIFRP